MKFTCSVDIKKPIDFVAKHFEDPETMKHCQKGFKRIEHLRGDKGQAGSQSKLIYEKFNLLETIVKNDLPQEFIGHYEHTHMTNTMTIKFNVINTSETRFISEIEYTKFNGIMIKTMAKLFPGMFRKQVQKWMDKFKIYVENAS